MTNVRFRIIGEETLGRRTSMGLGEKDDARAMTDMEDMEATREGI